MSESKSHMDLVQIAFKWIKKNLPKQYESFVEIDSPESNQPNYVDAFRPDVYYDFDNTLYIGEAKTLKDFDKKHSREQYQAYLKRCGQYKGEAYFVISIPWQLKNTAKNYFRLYKEQNNCNVPIIVLTDMNTESHI